MTDQQQPPQQQKRQPGIEEEMVPKPEFVKSNYRPSDKLKGKVAVITGGDSGIGRAVACLYALEGADVVISYLNEEVDAKKTKSYIEGLNRKCLLVSGDIGNENHCQLIIERCLNEFDKINILVNNAAEQHPVESIEEITSQQLERTFRTNIFSYFYMSKAAVKHLKEGGCIINSTSVTAYKGNKTLLDYSSTKGAISTFTYSLALSLIEKGIRVNGVAPGPIWTPLIPASFDKEHVAKFGSQAPLHRAGQPSEIAPCYLFLASDDSSYMTGQILHPNGGTIVAA